MAISWGRVVWAIFCENSLNSLTPYSWRVIKKVFGSFKKFTNLQKINKFERNLAHEIVWLTQKFVCTVLAVNEGTAV